MEIDYPNFNETDWLYSRFLYVARQWKKYYNNKWYKLAGFRITKSSKLLIKRR